MGYGHTLKDTVDNKVEYKETDAKEQHQDDDKQYDMVPETKLVPKGICVKDFQMIRNLNGVNTKMIMANLTLHIDIRTKAIYSFKSEEIH